MESPFTNREINQMFEALGKRLDTQDEILFEIKENGKETKTQTQLTNGKVADIQRWRERVIGMSQVSLVVVLPILGWALWTLTTIQNTVNESTQKAVQTALSNYNVVVKQ